MPDEDGAAERTRERIRELNDQLRTRDIGGQVLITAGIKVLGTQAIMAILSAVRRFDDFSADNDPYGEHDFGSLEVDGRRIFFKIDYYDPTYTKASEDPADPRQTRRVMTIMLAEEY